MTEQAQPVRRPAPVIAIRPSIRSKAVGAAGPESRPGASGYVRLPYVRIPGGQVRHLNIRYVRMA